MSDYDTQVEKWKAIAGERKAERDSLRREVAFRDAARKGAIDAGEKFRSERDEVRTKMKRLQKAYDLLRVLWAKRGPHQVNMSPYPRERERMIQWAKLDAEIKEQGT